MNNLDIIKRKLRIRDLYNGQQIKTPYGWKAICPFHKDNDPSFQVTEKEDGDVYFCFGCKSGGSVIDYIQNMQKIDFQQAIEYASNLLGIEYEKKVYFDRYKSIIDNLQVNHSFFAQRGISQETLKAFGCGYIDDPCKYQIDSDLISNDSMIMKVRDSIFYPIRERNGRSVGYYFRPIGGGNNKYISNSPIQLFGLNQLDITNGYVILVEGHNDVLKLHTCGIKNVLGLCGTNWTYAIAKILHDLRIYRVIILPDADQGGEKFVSKLINSFGTFDSGNVSLSVAWMDGFSGDPDEYVDMNRSFFENIIDHATDIIEMIYENEKKSFKYDLDIVNKMLLERPYLRTHAVSIALSNKISNLLIDRPIKTFYDTSFEEIVIGSAIIDPIARSQAMTTLSESDFAIDMHRNIFQFLVVHKNATLETVKIQFGVSFDKFDVGNVGFYIEKLKSYTKKRKLWEILSKFDYNVFEKSEDITPLFSGLMNGIASAAKDVNLIDSVDSNDVVIKAIDDINSDRFDGIDIGVWFPGIQRGTRGLPAGNLIGIGANSGVGKTSFLLNIIDIVSYQQNYRTLMMTGEMSPEDLMLRQFSIRSGLSYNGIIDRNLFLTQDQINNMRNANVAYSKLPTAEDMRTKLEILYTKHGGFDLIVLDYMQLVRSSGKKQRYEELSDLTRDLKTFAVDYNCCVLAAIQLNNENTRGSISKISNAAGSYNMVMDMDVGMTIRKKIENGDNRDYNEIRDGNLEINLDKVRRNKDKVLIDAYYNMGNLQIKEMEAINKGR